MELKYPYLPEGKEINYADLENPFMLEAKRICDASSCVKHPTGAVVVKDGQIIGRGSNASKHFDICPRWYSPTGTNYTACKEACLQTGHSEVTSIKNAQENGHDTAGADLYLYGHWWCCKPCWDAMIAAGIKNVYLMDNAWKLFNTSENTDMQDWGKPKKSLAYLKEDLGSEALTDIAYLANLLENEGRKRKRWEVYLENGEEFPYDGDVYSHSLITESIINNYAKYENLSDDQFNLLLWTAAFHDLGEIFTGDISYNLKKNDDYEIELNHIHEKISDNLKTEIVRSKLEQAIILALADKNPDDRFNYAEYFNMVERMTYLNAAMHMAASKIIPKWQILLSNVFYNQFLPFLKLSETFPSGRKFLLDHRILIDTIFQEHFTLEQAANSYRLVFKTDDIDEIKAKGINLSEEYFNSLKENWENFKKKQDE